MRCLREMIGLFQSIYDIQIRGNALVGVHVAFEVAGKLRWLIGEQSGRIGRREGFEELALPRYQVDGKDTGRNLSASNQKGFSVGTPLDGNVAGVNVRDRDGWASSDGINRNLSLGILGGYPFAIGRNATSVSHGYTFRADRGGSSSFSILDP